MYVCMYVYGEELVYVYTACILIQTYSFIRTFLRFVKHILPYVYIYIYIYIYIYENVQG